MNDTNKNFQVDLNELSQDLGNNLDWVQGAGGNTSYKNDKNLWVKASGYWLSDATKKNIFSQLDRKILIELIDQGIEDLQPAQIINENQKKLRPSIETSMHALMHHSFVAHVHSTNVISYATLVNGKELLQEKLGDINWLFVPYVRPGLPLTKLLKSLNASSFDVLILENHGVVVGSDSKDGVINLLLDIEKKLFRPLRIVPALNEKKKLKDIIKKTKYKLPKYDFCHSLAWDQFSLNALNKNPLYPDHIIFLGPGAVPILSEEDFINKLSFLSRELNYKIIIIKDLGIIVRQDLSANAEEMLHCLTNVLLKFEKYNQLKHLSKKEEMELLGWDAETYRKTIER
tara:strand:- start:428 stop:1459 length:1032 start_codon:yes stop_codon:yes gene_type:complete